MSSDKEVPGATEIDIPILLTDLAARQGVSNQIHDGDNTHEISKVQDPVVEEEESVGVMSTTRTALLGFGIMLTWFLGATTSTAVTLIVPSMAKDLDVSELEVQWVASAYSLAYGCGMLFMGRIADLYGRKLLYLLGLSIFVVFTIVSGAVRERNALYVLRAFAGLGLAIAGPAGYGIIGSNVRKEPARTVCFAALGIGAPAGAACGTLIGGAIAGISRRGWQYLFYVLGGFAVFPLVLGFFVVPRDTRSLRGSGLDRRVDWVGGALGTFAFSLLLFSLAQSGIAERGWNEPYIPALLGISVALLLTFYLWERYLEQKTTFPPILKPSTLTNHQYKPVGLIICIFSIALANHAFVYNTTIFYQNYKGMSPFQNGIHYLPSTICGLLVCLGIIPLVPRVRAPILMAVGAVLTGLACALYAIVPEGALYWRYEFPALLLLPWGIDLIVGVGNICISNLVEQKSQSVAGALSNTAYQIGVAFGFSTSSLVTTLQTRKTGSLLTGLHQSMWYGAAFCWIVPFVAFIFLRHVRLAKDIAVKQTT